MTWSLTADARAAYASIRALLIVVRVNDADKRH